MHPSAVLALLSLVSGSLGAFMPRRSATAPQCLACPAASAAGDEILVSYLEAGNNLLSCQYHGEIGACNYDATTGVADPDFPHLAYCPPSLAPTAFTCAPRADGVDLAATGSDGTLLTCEYIAVTSPTVYCEYSQVDGSALAGNDAACLPATLCGASVGRRFRDEDNFAAVKRKVEARTPTNSKARVPSP